ncbi:hypothetical protein SO802_008524 [Lithocarpus litseifolius]|uniref:NB-ARC domain-containing protein n=1 Tax=Lithocarpus litseifolius TaxID=425828 RepID=A0AAW2DB35_9ROSI
MAYIWNPVKGDIKRLTSLFYSLSKIETFKERKIADKLREKSEILLKALAEMVDNSEKRYKVDDEEKQDEGGALNDEEKQHERLVLELWLEGLEDAVFNTEDLVDKIHTEALRQKLDGQICEKMEDIRCSLESCVKQGAVLGLARRTYNMNLQGMHCPDKYLLDLNWRLAFLDLVQSLRKLQYRDRYLDLDLDPTDYIYFVDESEVFGMDCDKEEIINLLLSDDVSDRQLSVISIEGNGRIGKTTLARLVYNEQRVSDHFHLKAWVRVPDDFDRVTLSILYFFILKNKELNLRFNDYHKLNSDELGLELQQCLVGKRFLLVLDGAKQIPSSKEWKALRSALKDAANGSCIIVTTRNKDIAPKVDAVSTYPMEPLSEERSWPIFAKFAFGDQNPSSDTQLEVIGKEIVQMCHGLSSSVRILGSLLRFKLQQEEWEAILTRLKPSSDSSEDSRENVNVVPNLRLTEDLKRCLAYCSIFPPDYEFDMEKLLLLCMAEGFLEPCTTDRDSIIEKLKPFFQKSSRNESSFRVCRNNLADYVSTRYCFRLEDNHPSQIPLNTRYLSLVGGKYENSVIFEAIDRAELLRTFLPLDHESRHLCATELQNLLLKLQFLRVLSLSHFHITEIPDSIGKLEHLRYIDLSHTPIKRLPKLVCELYNLQSLILSNCHSLTELPKDMSNLENLLNLDISGSGLSEMPGMSKLKNLKLQPCFVAGKKSGSLMEFRNNTGLQRLHILKLQTMTSENDAGGTPLVGMHSLEELVLEWDDNTADPENATKVLAGLRPSVTSLKKLTINFYCGKTFPEWSDSFDKMVFLRLSHCTNCSTLPPLGNLPNLKDLIIEGMDAVEKVGPDFSADRSPRRDVSFCFLERLTFEGMPKWTEWDPWDRFQRLAQLCIRRCPKLRGNLPKFLPSGKRIEIIESQELVTALTTEKSLEFLRHLATGSSLIIEGEDIEKLNELYVSTVPESSLLVTPVYQTYPKWSKGEQKEYIEDPSQFPLLEVESTLPLPQRAAECSLLVTPGIYYL